MTRRLTAREVVNNALSLIGRYTPNDTAPEGHDVLRGLDWLDMVLATLMAERWVVQLTSQTRVRVPLRAGVNAYNLSQQVGPVDGIAYPLACSIVRDGSNRAPFDLVRLDEWERLRIQADRQGCPEIGHLDRTELLTMEVYPTPDENIGDVVIELVVASYPPTVAASPRKADRNTGNVPIGLRPEWSMWASYALAAALGDGPIVKLPATENDRLVLKAEKIKADLFAYVEREMPMEAPISAAWDPYGSPPYIRDTDPVVNW